MPPQEVIASFVGSRSRDVDDDARTDVRYVRPPGAKPERELAWRVMAVNRPGDCQVPGASESHPHDLASWANAPSCLRFRSAQASTSGEAGRRSHLSLFSAAGPRGHRRRAHR